MIIAIILLFLTIWQYLQKCLRHSYIAITAIFNINLVSPLIFSIFSITFYLFFNDQIHQVHTFQLSSFNSLSFACKPTPLFENA